VRWVCKGLRFHPLALTLMFATMVWTVNFMKSEKHMAKQRKCVSASESQLSFLKISNVSLFFVVDLCNGSNVEQATSNVSNQDVANFTIAMLNVSE